VVPPAGDYVGMSVGWWVCIFCDSAIKQSTFRVQINKGDVRGRWKVGRKSRKNGAAAAIDNQLVNIKGTN